MPKQKKEQEKKIYMIRRRTDGLYSSGGSYPTFSTRGKMWNRLSSLKTHLSNFYYDCYIRKNGKIVGFSTEKWSDMKYNPYINCDVVEAEINFTIKDDVFRVTVERFVK